MARQRSRIVCPMIIPGFDNTKSSPARLSAERKDGQTYRRFWEAALKTMPDWILISSWNEWAEGTEIEPSRESGGQYLGITAEYAKGFLESPTVEARACRAPDGFVPGTRLPASSLLAGRTVGVVMEDLQVDAEFWSLYYGAKAERLRWADLINPKVLSASNFPVLVFALNEHYTSSVNSTDDVTRALIRYLHEGGFLVALPYGTWPFLYDESRDGWPGITDTLALGVDNGFERPPGGVESPLLCQNECAVRAAAMAPFPTTGDLRWRPANRRRDPGPDIYVPLVENSRTTQAKRKGRALCTLNIERSR